MLGKAERHQARHDGLRREVHHLADLVLARHDHRGEDPAETESAGCEKHAPAERVDRGSPDKGVAVEVAIDCSERSQVGDDEKERRDVVEVFRESALACGRRKICCMRTAPRPRRAMSVTGAQGTRPAALIARYWYHPSR